MKNTSKPIKVEIYEYNSLKKEKIKFISSIANYTAAITLNKNVQKK